MPSSNGNGRFPQKPSQSSPPSPAWVGSSSGAADPLGAGDQVLQCRQCQNSFIYTAGEQAWYTDPSRNFATPVRCKPCRAQRKAEKAALEGNASPAQIAQEPARDNRGGTRDDAPSRYKGKGRRGGGWNDDY